MEMSERDATGQAPSDVGAELVGDRIDNRSEQMLRKSWKYATVVAMGLAVVAMMTAGSADAKRRGIGKTVEGSEVTDNTLTGADIDESTLQCTGPNGIPGCGVGAAPGTKGTLQTVLGTNASGQLGYPAVKKVTVTSTCPAGTKAVTGLVDILGGGESDNVYITAFGPSVDGTQFFATAKATSSYPPVPAQPSTLRVFAVCASIV